MWWCRRKRKKEEDRWKEEEEEAKRDRGGKGGCTHVVEGDWRRRTTRKEGREHSKKGRR